MPRYILKANSFLNSIAKQVRAGFTTDEITQVYTDKSLQGFTPPCIMIHALPFVETTDLNDRALRIYNFDIVCFSREVDEYEFQTWTGDIVDRLSHITRWVNVEGRPNRRRSYTSYSEQEQFMRLHFTCQFSTYVEYVNTDYQPEYMEILEQTIIPRLDIRKD